MKFDSVDVISPRRREEEKAPLPVKLIDLMPVLPLSWMVKTTSERPFGRGWMRPLTCARP